MFSGGASRIRDLKIWPLSGEGLVVFGLNQDLNLVIDENVTVQQQLQVPARTRGPSAAKRGLGLDFSRPSTPWGMWRSEGKRQR